MGGIVDENGFPIDGDWEEQETEHEEEMRMEEKKNIVTAEGTFKYYDEVPALIVEGENFEKTFYNDEARELFKILIGATNK